MNTYLKAFAFTLLATGVVMLFNPPILSVFLIPISFLAYKYGFKRALIPLVFCVVIGTVTSGTGMNSIYRRVPLFVSAAIVGVVVSYGRKLRLDIEAGEGRFKALFKGTPVPIFTWTCEGNDFILTDFNDAGAKITDEHIKGILGVKASVFYKNNPDILTNLYKSYKNQTTVRREGYFTFLTTGKNLYIDASFVYIAPDKVMVHAADITERVASENRIKESEERYMLAQEAGGIASWEWNPLTKQTTWSKNLPDLFGVEADYLTYDRFLDLVHPEDQERVRQSLETLTERKTDYEIEFRIERGGRERWMLAKGRLFIDDKGKPRKLVGCNMDITERKAVDERFRLVFENSPIAKIIANTKGVIVLANKQASLLTGYSNLENLPLESIMPERFREPHKGAYFHGGQFRKRQFEKDLCVLNKDGQEIPVEIGLNPVTINGEHYVLGTLIDVTERQRAVKEKEHLLQMEKLAKEEAENASKAKDEFLAVVSHELKTPLSSILGYSSLLASGRLGTNTEAAKLALSTIERSARNQASLIEDLLDISRIVSGRMQIKQLIVGIPGIVQQACESFAVAAEMKGVELRCGTTNDRLFVQGDPGRLQQVLSNLVDNAVKFTPKGGTVDVCIVPDGLNVDIIIKDSGIGIEPEFMASLFQRFKQESSGIRRIGQGLGLGLSIAQSLASLQKGTIRAESEGRGKGATFTVTFPLTSPPLEESAINGFDREHKISTLEGLTILAIDDDRDTLDMLKLALERYGAKVLTAESAEEGRVVGEKVRLDIIVCDVGMPLVSGYEFMKALRAEGVATPAMALTAFSGGEYERLAKESGFNHFLSKPIEVGTLIEGITYCLSTVDKK